MIHALAGFLAKYAIAALMLSTGLMTTKAVVWQLRRRGPLLLRALAVIWLVVPLLALAVTALLGAPPLATAALLLIAICPGVPLLVRSTQKAHGSTTTALMVLLAGAITAPILIPLWASILGRLTPYAFVVGATDVLKVVLPSVLVPFAIGRIIRMASDRVAAALARVAEVVFIAGLLVILVAVLARSAAQFTATPLRAYVAAIVITVGAALCGYRAGGPRIEDRTALAYAAALGNPALALAIAAHTQPHASALPVIGFYVVLRTITLVPFGLWRKRPAHAT